MIGAGAWECRGSEFRKSLTITIVSGFTRIQDTAGTQLNADPEGSPLPAREVLGVAARRAPRALLFSTGSQWAPLITHTGNFLRPLST